MSLIRGPKSKHPCPVCLVKGDELANITKTWPLRTADQTKDVIEQARALQNNKEREKLLSGNGIRDVDVSNTCTIYGLNLGYGHNPECFLEVATLRPTPCAFL
jgi:hypothetical protein